MNRARDFDLDAYCAGLPEPTLPEALQGEVVLAYRRRRARRRAIVASVAVAAFAVVGLGSLRLLPPGKAPSPATSAASMAAAVPRPAQATALRDIDRRLQAAYDAGASDTEVEALWAQRAVLAARGPAAVPLAL